MHHCTLKNSIFVKVHQTTAEVPVQAEGQHVEDCQDSEGREEVVRSRQHVEGAVAQESDVDVVAEGNQPQGVPQQCRNEHLPFYIEQNNY